ncbi:hypothetical protein [Streptomyces uncialis]|uniref:Uncharacterized protein n=1 Tax=Streptomyces uncialis TaxID=1048205 RepID=A0A1Q4VCI7_9ACTN|nr:hypothetical protein [Streptomyces uncialis]MCX4661383.1 hypothetical protein [Streptomyces uncialis]OKH95526.1 hypothetical protein AB852_01480 [Streptomyces uncialis]WTE12053.1 hypothetical protein OG924_18405 [Streptomyces uncialis]
MSRNRDYGDWLGRAADWAGLLGAGFLLILAFVAYLQGQGVLWMAAAVVIVATNLFTFGPRSRKRREAKERARAAREREPADG